MNAPTNTDPRYADDYTEERSSASFSEQLDIQHYLRILRKHKLPITLFTTAITCLAAYYAYTATPEYSSTATMIIDSQESGVPTFESLVGGDTKSQDYYQTQFELLRGRALATRVVNHLGLWTHPELSPQAREDATRVAAAERSVLGSDIEKPSGLEGIVSSVTSIFSPKDVPDFTSRTVIQPFIGFPGEKNQAR